jgi:hypothetical protein
LEFLIFQKEKQTKKKRKNKNEKNYLHGKAPNKQKKNKEIFLGFLLIATKERKKSRKETRKYFLDFLKVFQTSKMKARK